MDTHPATDALHQELLRHARWLEQLARHLVREDEAAADLAQDTLLAALRHPPRRLGDLRPWLARVMRNRHRDLGRQGQRRQRREARAATPEAAADSAATVERLELEQTLLAAVKDLEEPYRTAVTLRYLEAQEPADIARRQGVPAGTVRWRISEGLNRLRRRLDQDRGGRETWLRALLPVAGLGTVEAKVAAVGLPALLLGSLAMKITVAAVAVAALAWALGAWWTEPPSTVDGTGATTEGGAVVASNADAPDPGADAAPPPDRQPVTAPVARTDPGAQEATSAPAVPVSVRVVDEQGLPLAGVLVRSPDIPDLQAGLRTDGAGEAGLAWADAPVGRSAALLVAADGRESRELRQEVRADGLDFGVVTLRPGARVAGRVLDESGAPQAGARVTADDGAVFLLAETYASADTDAEGRFRFDGLPEGFVRLRTGLAGDRMDREQETTLELRRGQPQEDLVIRVTRPPGSGVTDGVVLRPDGSPAAHAELFARAENDRSRNTFRVDVDGEGRFSIQGWRYEEYTLTAVDRDDPALHLAELTVARGARGLALQLEPVDLVALVIRDPDGNPVEDAQASLYVQVDPEGRPERRMLHLSRREGRRWFAPPVAPYEFEVRAPGFEVARSDRFDPARAREVVEVTLTPLPRVTGRVTRSGRPVAGARVRLLQAVGADRVVHVDGLRRQWVDLPTSPPTVTDDDGRFAIPFVPPAPPAAPGLWDRLRGRAAAAPRPFAVEVATDGEGFAFSDPLLLEQGRQPPPPLTLELTPGGSLEGTLFLAAGEDPSTHWILAGNGAAETRATRPDAAGRYRFADLPAGPWLVQDEGPEGEPVGIESSSGVSEASPVEFDCVVVPGGTARFDIDRRAEPRVQCRLRLDGKSPGPWTATLWRRPSRTGGRPSLVETASVDAQGRFLLAPTRAGEHELNLFGQIGGEGPQVELLLPLSVAAGPATWSMEIRTAPLTGTCEAGGGHEDLQWRGILEDGGLWMCPLEPGPDGAFRAVVPLGSVALVRADPADPLGAPQAVLREWQVTDGGLDGLTIQH